MAEILQVVVFRQSNDERTCGVIRCERTKTVYSGDTLRAALIRAVTNWMNQTREGRTALEASADDFNIGDLMNELPDRTLEPFLEAEGVRGLEVETYCGGETDWTYDERLFDEERLSLATDQRGQDA